MRVSKEGAKNLLLEEICEYLPITADRYRKLGTESQHQRTPVHQHNRRLVKPARAKNEDQKPLPGGGLCKKRHRFGVHGGCSLRRLGGSSSNPQRPRRDRIASGCSNPTGIGRGHCWCPPDPVDSCGGNRTDDRLARRKILTPSTRRFGASAARQRQGCRETPPPRKRW